MKNLKNIIVLFSLLTLIVSCGKQKDTSYENEDIIAKLRMSIISNANSTDTVQYLYNNYGILQKEYHSPSNFSYFTWDTTHKHILMRYDSSYQGSFKQKYIYEDSTVSIIDEELFPNFTNLRKSTYYINSDNQCEKIEHHHNIDGEWQLVNPTEIYTWEKGNLVEKIIYEDAAPVEKYSYTYDDKNNPMNAAHSFPLPFIVSKNNPLTVTRSNSKNSTTTHYTYTYNTDNFPIIINIDEGITIKNLYEYNY